MVLVKLFPNHRELSGFKGADRDAPLGLGAPDQRSIHQLQDRTLSEGVYDRLHATALFEEEALE